MKAVFLFVISAAWLATGARAGAAPADADIPCLRTDDPLVSKLVTRGLRGSDTFRRLYQQLEDSNLIVHLHRGTKMKPGSGYNQFITSAGSHRFVRITLNVVDADDGAVALLGHELRHAVELADARAVDDGPDYERLYRRIGYVSCMRAAGRCYETDAAVVAGRNVLRELRNTRVGPAGAAAQLIRRWMAQFGGAGWSADAEEAP